MRFTKGSKVAVVMVAVLAPVGTLLGLSQTAASSAASPAPVTAVATTTTGVATTTTTTTTPPLGVQPYGVNFGLHSDIDQNYCIEATANSSGSPLSVSQCAARDNQHWTFAEATDGSFVMISGLGTCISVDKQSPFGMDLGPCTFNGSEHFQYNEAGQFENRSAKLCLQYAQPAQDASVFFTKCNPNVTQQVIVISH
jgi:hypothetical protein